MSSFYYAVLEQCLNISHVMVLKLLTRQTGLLKASFPLQVEKLLETYMQEVGINEQQLMDACTSPFAKSPALQVFSAPPAHNYQAAS